MTIYYYITVDENGYINSGETSENGTLGAPRILVDRQYNAGDAYAGGVVYPRPTDPYHGSFYMYSFDFTNLVWLADQEQFTPYLASCISQYRDAYLQNPVEFVFGEDTFLIKNDQRTQNAIAAYDRSVAKENNAEYTVDFLTATDEGEPELWVTLDGDKIQTVDLELTRNMKKAFDAHKAVMDTHAITPFTVIQDALDAFDLEMA